MKVWVVLEYVPYEGTDIRGVFSTEHAATSQADIWQRGWAYSQALVEEWEVQGELPNVIRRERPTKEFNPAQLELLLGETK